MKTPKSQRDAARRYIEAKTKQYMFRFRIVEDAEIVAKLDSVPCKVGYIRELVLKDLSNGCR